MLKRFPLKFRIIKPEPNNGYLLVKAKINSLPVVLLIDTGASHSCIDNEFLHNISPQLHEVTCESECVTFDSSNTVTHLYSINTLQLGRNKFYSYLMVPVDLTIINKAFANQKNPIIHGILGCDFFIDNNAVIDFRQKTITFS